MKTIIFDPGVKLDLQRVKAYYNKQRRGLGKEFVARARDQFQRIALYPLAAPIVERDVRKIGMEKFPYEIYYQVDEQVIFVFAVIHQRRHQDTWKKHL